MTQDLAERLIADITERLLNDKTVLNTVTGHMYFKNSPNDFLPWSARNTTFSEEEKRLILDKFNDGLLYFSNMRWYLSVNTVRGIEKVVRNAIIN